jgi:hypothetical protein
MNRAHFHVLRKARARPFPRGEGNSRQTSQSREPPRDARSGKTPCQTPCQQGVWLVRHVHALASEHVQRRFGRSRAPARFGRPCPSPRCRPNMESASATRPALLSADTVGASRATSARFNLRERSQRRLADHFPAQAPCALTPCHVPEPAFPLNRPVPLAL